MVTPRQQGKTREEKVSTFPETISSKIRLYSCGWIKRKINPSNCKWLRPLPENRGLPWGRKPFPSYLFSIQSGAYPSISSGKESGHPAPNRYAPSLQTNHHTNHPSFLPSDKRTRKKGICTFTSTIPWQISK